MCLCLLLLQLVLVSFALFICFGWFTCSVIFVCFICSVICCWYVCCCCVCVLSVCLTCVVSFVFGGLCTAVLCNRFFFLVLVFAAVFVCAFCCCLVCDCCFCLLAVVFCVFLWLGQEAKARGSIAKTSLASSTGATHRTCSFSKGFRHVWTFATPLRALETLCAL